MAMVDTALLAGVGSSLIFVLLNVAMNLYMKWLFSESGANFAFPWTMLAVQQLQSYLVLQPWIAIKFPSQRCGWDMADEGTEGHRLAVSMQVLAVTGLFCLNVGLNSLSMVRISITLNQTVRAFLPVGVLVLATVVERRTYDKHSYVTTAILILGIALTCWGSPDFEACGFLLALASTIVAAAGTSLNGRLLSAGPFSGKAGPEKIARLMMLQSVPAFVIFSTIATLTEGPQLCASLQGMSMWEVQKKLGLITVSSALALMANLGRCFLVAATSALMETLAGNAKVAALCIIDHELFGTILLPYNYLGIAITFAGFSIHLLLQYASKQQGKQSESLTKVPAIPEDKAAFDISQLPNPRLNLPRMISGAETGLASEHLALRLGKPTPKHRHHQLPLDDELPTRARQHAATWQPGTDPTRTWLERVGDKVGMDLAPVIEAPPWLSDDQVSETWSMSTHDSEFMSSSPRSCSREKADRYDPLILPAVTQLSRNRVWSDMTHSHANPRPL